MTKEKLIQILEDNQDAIESGNWEAVYQNIDQFYRGELSDFLIQNDVDPSTLFKKYIPYHAFRKSELLTSINIQKSVIEINPGAFDGCKSLKSIRLPDSLIKIEWHIFDECKSLESITIPNNVIEICECGLARCKSLESITLPNSLKEIGKFAFTECSSLTSITIPHNVTRIGYGAFANCTSLEEIKYDGTEEEWNNIELGEDWNYKCPAKIIFLK